MFLCCCLRNVIINCESLEPTTVKVYEKGKKRNEISRNIKSFFFIQNIIIFKSWHFWRIGMTYWHFIHVFHENMTIFYDTFKQCAWISIFNFSSLEGKTYRAVIIYPEFPYRAHRKATFLTDLPRTKKKYNINNNYTFNKLISNQSQMWFLLKCLCLN